jgi:hypothetical protein
MTHFNDVGSQVFAVGGDVKRKWRVALLLPLMLVMVFAFTTIANLTGSVVWLMLWLTGIVADVSSGPIWVSWMLYVPTVILYAVVLVVGFLWIRAAPRSN